MESKANEKGGDENLVLIGQMRKDKGKGFSKGKGKSEESTSQLEKKDLNKLKCVICHKCRHYASQRLGRRREKGSNNKMWHPQ